MIDVTHIAMICHEANRAYCNAIGDHSQPTWASAPQWQVESVVDGVKFHLAVPGSKPQDSHFRWLKKKESEGWTYGEVKDSENQTHPCMVPFDQLPPEQQAKDHLFLAIVRGLEPFLEKDAVKGSTAAPEE